MGLFSAASDQRSSPQHSVDYTSEAPNRNNRTHCWEARDEYFRCLDRNGIIDSVRDKSNAAKKCPQESQEFDAKCASSWVQYFKKRRLADHKKEETLRKLQAEGAQLPTGGRQ